MTRFALACLSILLLPMLAACQRDGGNTPATDSTASPSATVPAATLPVPVARSTGLQDAQAEALAYLAAINEHEVAAAEQARGKGVDERVLAYADMLHAAHIQGLEATQALAASSGIALHDSADVAAMRARNQASLEQLALLDESEFADAYLDAMVAGHSEVLALIDEKLMPAATTDALRAQLTSTRASVAKHLAEARELQGAKQ